MRAPAIFPRCFLVALILALVSWPTDSFVVQTPTAFSAAAVVYNNNLLLPVSIQSNSRSLFVRLHMVADHHSAADLDSTDPWRVLGVSIGADQKEIKRAYRRLAMKYHPDVTEETTDKQVASEQFAKINWAYETALGKRSSGSASSSARSSSSSRSSSTSGGWEPPHRRTGAYSSGTTSSGSTDWRDYMPNYDSEDAKYDTGGDSFEKIFSDMFKGAAAGAAAGGAGGVGIFRDFVEFLEQNVDGYSGGSNDDAELRVLLQTGSADEIGEEMDETELVVQQLTSKLTNVKNERIQVQADLAASARYMAKIELQERLDELEARQGVVEGYIKRARKRLVSLQTRYKELIVNGQNDRRAGGRSSSSSTSWEDIKNESSNGSSASTSDSSPSRSRTSSSSADTEDAWKDEGFGSFGRGRGSSRRRSSRRTANGSEAPPSSSGPSSNRSSTSDYASSAPRGSSYSSSSSRPTSSESAQRPVRETTQAQEPYVPPHRRQSSFARQEEDKRRLRELKVDEEFDKLKKDLGL